MAKSNPFTPNYYPPVNFHFAVYFGAASKSEFKKDNMTLAGEGMSFQSVSGLTVQMQTESIKEGGENFFEHTVPVRAKYSDLILKRGLVYEGKILKWLTDAFENFKFEPMDLQVHLLNEGHETLVSWDVVHAWPKNWKFDELNAEQGKVFVETLELCYNSFRMRKG